MQTQPFFTDLDFNFNIHPVTKDLVLSNDEQAIIRSVKNLVLTNHYERPFQSSIGSRVSQMLFEPITPLTANYVQREIYDTLTAFEPRITNLAVDVQGLLEEDALIATISFYIDNSTVPTVVDILLERVK